MSNKTFFLMLVMSLSFSGALAGENILSNPEFKIYPYAKKFNSRFNPWWSNIEINLDQGYRAKNSITSKIPGTPAKTVKWQLSQPVHVSEPGVYLLSAYYKQDKKVERVRLLRLVQAKGKEDDYQIVTVERNDLPEPGKWGRVMAELNLPAGNGTIALQVFDKAGATIWFDSVSLTKKAEE